MALAFVMSQSGSVAKVEDLAWLAGAWTCEIWGGTFEESWSKPSGGTMQATGRHIAKGQTGMMEFLTIESVKGKIAMFISVGALSENPRPPARFDLKKLDAKTAVFEREKENDFPKTISYSLKSADELECVLAGTENGRAQKAEFHFKRMK